MRIIAGKYRGRRLKSPPSDRTRPTSDRLRETLFNVLAPRIQGTRFLDLCAGTGAVGIEALSRGAEQVTFVDQSRKMCRLIEENLKPLPVEEEQFAVVTSEAAAFLHHVAKQGAPSLTVGLLPRAGDARFGLTFFDPPYSSDYERVLTIISENATRLLTPDAIVVVEHRKQKELPAESGALKRYRELRHGDSVLSFYEIRQ